MTMRIGIEVQDAETLAQLHGLSVDGYMDAWGESVKQLFEKNAREKLGGDFGKRIANSVRQNGSGLRVFIDLSGPEGYIGEAVHYGGDFRSKKKRYLALPLDARFQKGGAEAGIFPRNSSLKMIFVISKKKNKLLFEKPEKGQPLGKPLFLLRESFRHNPRPWIPTEEEANRATEEFFEENF